MRYLFVLSFALSLTCHGQLRNPYYGIGVAGDSADVVTPTEFGVVLMGGSTDVDEALKWMIQRSGGGDFVILRASGSTGYNDYIKGLGKVNSVETLLLDSREKAMTKEVGQRIREAEAVFLAGGDQWNYVNYWSNSEVSSALHYLIHDKKIPIGGTSAGCAVLSGICFDARHDTSVSKDALANPYHQTVSLSTSFIEIPFLNNVIADQHYTKRERQGRHVVFIARMVIEQKATTTKGIGVDEKTAVCIDAEGNALVLGQGAAYFLVPQSIPETCRNGQPLHWNNQGKAIAAYVVPGTPTGTPAFNLGAWPIGKPNQYWSVANGQLQVLKAE